MTLQRIPIGTATGGSDQPLPRATRCIHRTDPRQLQQTTKLRMCRADLDPPRSDGLLCRIVGVAFRARTTHKHRIGESIKPWPISRARVHSVARFSSNMSDRVGNEASEAWRDHLLKQVVDYLETHRNAIIESFEVENAYNLKREDIDSRIHSISMSRLRFIAISHHHLDLDSVFSRPT